MNLRAIAGSVIAAINPPMVATLYASTGFTTNADGTRTPTYAAPITVTVDRQSLSSNDIQQISGLNLQGDVCSIYIPGQWQGLSRAEGTGADLISLPDGTNWLVQIVLENWDTGANAWTKVAAVRQVP